MYYAKLNPKRKMSTLDEINIQNLYDEIVSTLTNMSNQNGRDTEKIFMDGMGTI